MVTVMVVAALTIASCAGSEQVKSPGCEEQAAASTVLASASTFAASQDLVNRAVWSHRREARECYTRMVQKFPDDLGTSIRCSLTITPNGVVTDVACTGTGRREISDCIADKIRSFHLVRRRHQAAVRSGLRSRFLRNRR